MTTKELKIPNAADITELAKRDFIVAQCLDYGLKNEGKLSDVDLLRIMAVNHANLLSQLMRELIDLQSKQPKGFQPASFMGFQDPTKETNEK